MNIDSDDAPATKGDLKALRRAFALETVKTHARIDQFEDALRGEMRALSSKLTQQIDGFMSQVGKIDRAQIIADWRMTQLEERVDKIEPRPS